MRRILIVSHFYLADGFKSSLDYFMPNANNVDAICAFVDGVDVEKAIDSYMNNHNDDEIIAFTDILFGSVNQMLTKYLSKENFHLITGINLPILLEIATKPSDIPFQKEEIKRIVNNCRSSITYMNTYKAETSDEDE